MVPTVFTVPNVTAVVLLPLHITWLPGRLTWAVGLTVMVNVLVGPVHPTPPLVKVGVTTMVATTGAVPAFVAENAAMFPVPVAARPMPGAVFVQEYVVVPTVFTVPKVIAVVLLPLQIT